MILAAPQPNSFGCMQYSPATSTVTLVNTANFPALLTPSISTWQWKSGAWVLTNAGLANNPAPRTLTSLAYDTTGTQLLLFGGISGDGQEYRNDLVSYSASSVWTTLIQNYNDVGLSIGIITTSVDTMTYPNTVVQSNITGTTGLTIRYSAYMFALSTGVLLFGGNSMPGMNFDCYQYASGSWTTLTPATLPTVRTGAAFASNSTDTAVLFGGANTSTTLNDLWVYTTESGTWSLCTTNTPPSVRRDAVMTYYPTGGYYILFGGQDTAGNCLNQTYTLSISGTVGTWTLITTPTTPNARIGAMMAWSASSSQLLLFGGEDNWSFYGDTWEFLPGSSTWVNLLNPTATY
jgi:hypothetical protein